MLEGIAKVVGPILEMLAEKYGPVGVAVGYLVLFVVPLVSVLIELVEVVAAMTPTDKDDKKVALVRAKYDGVIKALEWLPHFNLPLAPLALTVLKWARKGVAVLKAAVAAWKA